MFPHPHSLSAAPRRHALARAGRWTAACTLGAVATLALTACGGGSDANPPLASKPLAEACAAYASTALPHGAKVTRTELRKADATLPDACIVRGQIVSSPESTINWAVELPTLAQWNGKTLTIGGGGFDGFIPTDDPWYQKLVGPSANPYVKISSDSGHQQRNFSWGNSDVALRNHATTPTPTPTS